MDDVIRIADQYYILSTSSLADDRTRALKHGDTFAVFDRRGDIEPAGRGVQGLYHEDTRYLSEWVLRLGGTRPLLLSSAVKDDNASLSVDLTNADLYEDGKIVLPRGTLHLERSKFLWRGTCYERLRVFNYGQSAARVTISVQFAADFADLFEVRGVARKRRGERRPPEGGAQEMALGYAGLDGTARRTRVRCVPRPERFSASEIQLDVHLPPGAEQSYVLTVACEAGDSSPAVSCYEDAAGQALEPLRRAQQQGVQIFSANEQFNDWVNRSFADLRMLITDTPHGPYPYAGVPWFCTAFGRDGILTALATLWMWPEMARGVLSFLAATQARELRADSDAEPGKILHEMRQGEMAALGEVPFARYYGSVDATPLFVVLAGLYHRRTADRALLEAIWPNLEAALQWMDEFGDADGDGLLEYRRRSAAGLVQQGWKDSADSVFHSDGTLAEPPIALCEVQGYAYAARREAAELARALGKTGAATRLAEQAEALRRRFEEAFWCDSLGTYALALDGAKRPCRVRASNAGHCLFAGIAQPERAAQVAETLLAPDFFTGWGVRTLSSREVRYNPMSYHNGSVWPHDNAIIAAGLARYGYKDGAVRILTGLLDASLFLDLHRLPELFCGFDRRPSEGPTLYPVACAPQAWAAAAVFLLLQSCLGLEVQDQPPRVVFRHAMLPASLPSLEIRNLPVGGAPVDLMVERAGHSVGVTVLHNPAGAEIVSVM